MSGSAHESSAAGTGRIVEFSGLPGAGKSFLAARLRTELQANGVVATDGLGPVAAGQPTVGRLAGKARLAGGGLVADPRGALRSIIAIRGSGQPLSQLVRRSQNLLVVRRAMATARRAPGVHLFDQGLVQELHSVGYAGRWEGVVPMFGPGTGGAGADVLVSVRVSPELASARLAARADAGSRLDQMTPEERLPWLSARAAELVEVEDRWLAAHASVIPTRRIVVEIGDDDPATLGPVIQRLLEAVRSDG